MIQLANAPCSWGVLEFTRDAGAPLPFSQVLDEIAASGYAGTELGDWGFLPTDPSVLHESLEARGLALAGAFVPVALADPAAHEGGERVARRTARLLRDVTDTRQAVAMPPPVLVLADDNCAIDARRTRAGRIQPADGLDEAQWETFAQGAERIARAVREEAGLKTAFHAHCGGYVETEAEIDRLLARTDPRLLGLCVDTGHLTYGGADVLQMLSRHVDRVWHVHFKDCDAAVATRARTEQWDYLTAVGHGLFCELGAGRVPFDAVIHALREHAYAGWIVVEQDVLPARGTPLKYARRNRVYLRTFDL